MKKLLLTFSLLASVMMARAITATIYVQADEAPYLYGWFTVNGKETKINGTWPGKQMTETVTKTDKNGQAITFWCQTFNIESSSFNIIFNNGKDGVDKEQTGNISNISSDIRIFFIFSSSDFCFCDQIINHTEVYISA